MKQSTINNHLTQAYKHFDAVTPKVCSGCGRSDKPLTHSHIISQKRCKEIGKEHLIYMKMPLAEFPMASEYAYNFVYDCHDCHQIWEAVKNPAWKELNNIFYRNDILKMFDPEGYKIRIGLVSILK